MNLGKIVTAVQRVLKDASILRTEIIEEVNLQQKVATVGIKNAEMLYTSPVTVAQYAIAALMPANYHHSLVWAYSITYDHRIEIISNTKNLYKDYTLGSATVDSPTSSVGFPFTFPFTLDETSDGEYDYDLGVIEECTVEGKDATTDQSIIWVKKATSESEDLQVRYYRKPTDMSSDSDEPDGIPEELHSKILVSGTLIEKLPESSLDPKLISTLMQLHGNKYTQGLIDLRKKFPYAPAFTPKPRRKVKEF